MTKNHPVPGEMRMWSRYGLTGEHNSSFLVVAKDSDLSAVEVTLAITRTRMWGLGPFSAERADNLTRGLVDSIDTRWQLIQLLAYPEAL
jgi:hypothetical protein